MFTIYLGRFHRHLFHFMLCSCVCMRPGLPGRVPPTPALVQKRCTPMTVGDSGYFGGWGGGVRSKGGNMEGAGQWPEGSRRRAGVGSLGDLLPGGDDALLLPYDDDDEDIYASVPLRLPHRVRACHMSA